YREHKASLIRIQHEQAEAAAAKISQFIKEIESQLGWTTQLPWSAGSIEQRRFDALRLLRQVPAITELAQVDSTGTERLRGSRLPTSVLFCATPTCRSSFRCRRPWQNRPPWQSRLHWPSRLRWRLRLHPECGQSRPRRYRRHREQRIPM